MIVLKRRVIARLRRVGARAGCLGFIPRYRDNPCRCSCYGCSHHCAACWYRPENLTRKVPR